MVNFDNSATTFPKPQAVRRAVDTAIAKYGGNPGRSGHSLSMAVSQQIFKVRNQAAEMFGAQVQNVAFTPNCTFALNMAIKGIMQFGGHIIISGYEHNASARPVYALSRDRGVEYDICRIYEDTDKTIAEAEKLIRKDTKCICVTAASNVTGRILPYKEFAALAKKHGLVFILDGAQACGTLDIKMSDGINFLCTSGHKGLYGPTGTGLLISDGEYRLSTIIEGGTGATSNELAQTPFLPEQLESGTLNTVGIIGLGEGLKFVKRKTPGGIFAHEDSLCRQFTEGVKKIPGIKFFDENVTKVPIRGFNIGQINSAEFAAGLNKKGFGLRGGLQCAAVAHNTLGTINQGVVRFAPGIFNTSSQVEMLVKAVKQCAKELS